MAIYPQSLIAYVKTHRPKYLLVAMGVAILIAVGELHFTARNSPGPFALLCVAGLNLWTTMSCHFANQEVVLGPDGLVLGEDLHPWNSTRATADAGCVQLPPGRAMKLRVNLTTEELATVRA
jgi:hypothetical protein